MKKIKSSAPNVGKIISKLFADKEKKYFRFFDKVPMEWAKLLGGEKMDAILCPACKANDIPINPAYYCFGCQHLFVIGFHSCNQCEIKESWMIQMGNHNSNRSQAVAASGFRDI